MNYSKGRCVQCNKRKRQRLLVRLREKRKSRSSPPKKSTVKESVSGGVGTVTGCFRRRCLFGSRLY